MRNKIFGIYSLLAASAFALTACVGNAPAPETEPTNVSANASSEQEQPSTLSSDLRTTRFTFWRKGHFYYRGVKTISAARNAR